nr:wax ester/triacylglycerol synthase family O-acyltransferase [Psychrobacter sp. PraFG1]UTT87671.1 wax ester/triacylglycerol synthase family O-acyltransferase [Psychrobacter sp. PraFG1]
MHVGGLFLFDIPDNSDNHFVADLVRQMRSSTTPPTFPFDQVVHNQTFWKSADKVDIHYHFHHMVLPKPYSKQALYSYVSDVHANMLDKGYPLWECHIIEGIEADHVDVSAPLSPYTQTSYL